MPQKGDMILALQLLPDNKDLLSFFQEKVVERSRKQKSICINSEGYSYAYQNAVYADKIKGNPYDDPHILKRGCYVVENLIWGKLDDEIGIIVSLNEV